MLKNRNYALTITLGFAFFNLKSAPSSLGLQLINASYRGDAEKVQELLNKKINVNVANKEGNTPLHMAIVRNHIKIAEMLIDAGASLQNKNSLGYTPVNLAWSLEAFDLLLKKGASPIILNSKDLQILRDSKTFQALMHFEDQALKEKSKEIEGMTLEVVSKLFDTIYIPEYAKQLKQRFLIVP